MSATQEVAMSTMSFPKNLIAKDAKMFRFNLFLTITAPILLILAVLTIRLGLSQSTDRQRADAAEAARWTGLAQLYALANARYDQQRADVAEAARWTGLALREFERTGDRRSLPQCIPANVMTLLPGSGNSPGRSLVPTCSQ
jgi:hypothetical protein